MITLIGKTTGIGEFENKTLDEIIAGQARVSTNKKGEKLFEKPEGLIRHMLVNQHWSPFDMVNFNFKIITSRAMAREWLRHWSIHPQEFSQRYSEVTSFQPIELRIQSEDNRQSSTDVLAEDFINDLYNNALNQIDFAYQAALKTNVSKETARFILPEAATTVLYLNGTLRSFITALNVRLHKSTAQKEIRLQAEEIKEVLIKEVPIVSKALFNFEYADKIHILEQLVLHKHGVRELILDKLKNRNEL